MPHIGQCFFHAAAHNLPLSRLIGHGLPASLRMVTKIQEALNLFYSFPNLRIFLCFIFKNKNIIIFLDKKTKKCKIKLCIEPIGPDEDVRN
jgi:hypothetical protein